MNQKEHAILVVDDNDDIRDTVREMLSEEGYSVITAANGQEALNILRAGRQRVCLILLDLMMPVLDGWRFREIQQADASIASIPVVVVTASGRAENLTGQVALMKKPISVDDLLAAVSAYC